MSAGVGSDEPEDSLEVRNLMPGSAGAVVQADRIEKVVLTQASAPAPHRTRVPCQVPAAKGRFVNRRRELARARRLVDVGGRRPPRILVVGGMPGVGKSALGFRVAESVRESYSGGVLYINFTELRGGPEPAVSDALVSCLRALGVADAVIPSSLAELTKLFRSHTADEPVLVMLDDVTETGQVRPLVPAAPGSAVLVTSTGRLPELSLDGAELLWLEPLDQTSGERLIKGVCRRAGEEPDALAELVELCGRLPIALEIAAARLRDRPGLSVRALCAEIADTSRGLAALSVGREARVSAVFSLSYRDLPAAAQRMYRLLGALPFRDFDLGLVAVAAGAEQAVAEELLDLLVGAGLLSENADGRCGFHGLVRRHAIDQAHVEDSEDEQINALHRTVRYLLIRTVSADLAAMDSGRLRITPSTEIVRGVTDPFAGEHPKARALDWLDAERANLLAAMKAAADRGWHDMCWQLAESVTALYVSRRYLVDWAESATIGANSAHLGKNAAAEARLRSFGSRAWTELGDLDRAGRELNAALPLAERAGNPRLLASVWEMVARYRDHAEPAAAGQAYDRALELFAGADDGRGVAFTTYFHGRSLAMRARWAEALDVLERARDLVAEVDDERMRGRVLTTLGTTLGRLGRDTEAVEALRQAIGLLGGHRHFEAQAWEALGEIAISAGDAAYGREALRRAVEIHTDLGGPDAERLRVKLAGLPEA
ncbi:tetratricopeptide repeat protein [Amycolatopsis taiwanensis]|uniref:Orc1-like AAA ATPase domain-containing protein n=1 Tax=Amycolatopsis taiwanensis TaxID=342230 RepID=A0A9W6VD62_9PSEU|nr:tetratricopeptide repeat protein [Amycolatopsis taiwanensis]GLY66953.1 hypothetical protein Atai01_35720 [Amycolatopsis taiwanensis]